MPEITLSPGLSIHYLDSDPSGRLPAVVLLHGLGATAESWQLQIPALTEAGFRSIAIDARGFGQSVYPGGKITIAAFAQDTAHLLQHLEIPSAHVVGISMGGTTALELGCGYAQLVDKLVLVDTFARLNPPSPAGWLYFLWRFILVQTLGVETQARAVAQHIFPHPDQAELRQELIAQVKQAHPKAYRGSMRALAAFNRLDCLSNITAPTLVVTGSEDTTVPLNLQRQLAERIPGARQVIIPGAGHAVTVDQPEAFNRALLDFLCS